MRYSVVLCLFVAVVAVPVAASYDPAVAHYLDYKEAMQAQVPMQGDRTDPWYRQCGGEMRLFGTYRGGPRTQRVEMEFSFTCGLFTQAWDASGPEAHFAIYAHQGLQVYQAEAYVRQGQRETRQPLCRVNVRGVPEVPYGVLDWSDASGPYRFVGVRERGELLAEGEQAIAAFQDGHDLDCYLLICVRGRGDCAIPVS